MFKTIKVGEREIKLRYPTKVYIPLLEEMGKEYLGVTDRDIELQEILPLLDRHRPFLRIFERGMEWSGSGVDLKSTSGDDIYDEYIASGTPDCGERESELKMAVAEALCLSRGLDLKKLMEIGKAATEAEQETAEETAGTGKKRTKPASARSD